MIQSWRSKGCCSANEQSRHLKRCKTISTSEKNSSELKEGSLPDAINIRESHARRDIELAILLTTMNKAQPALA